jgi:hypothetical protein
MRGKNGKRYNPNWLVGLAKKWLPYLESLPWYDEGALDFLPEALGNCTSCIPESHCYIHFVNNDKSNQEGAPWQFITAIQLKDEKLGIITVDLLLDLTSENPYEADPVVGGIEYVDMLNILPPILAERHFYARLRERIC